MEQEKLNKIKAGLNCAALLIVILAAGLFIADQIAVWKAHYNLAWNSCNAAVSFCNNSCVTECLYGNKNNALGNFKLNLTP